jgi:hypothetical protein
MAVAQSSTESRIAKLKSENARLKAALAVFTEGGDGQPVDAATIENMSQDELIAFGPAKAMELVNKQREAEAGR